VAFGRDRKRRGGTPTGERATLRALPCPLARQHERLRLPAFCFLSFFFADRSVIEPKAGPTPGSGMTRSGFEDD